jgi:hypothetical protein
MTLMHDEMDRLYSEIKLQPRPEPALAQLEDGIGSDGAVCATLGVILAFCSTRTSVASPSACQDAVAQYNSAISDISSALRRYMSCVSSSNGHDDCSSEFRRLKSAQSDFEDAVSKYGLECN